MLLHNDLLAGQMLCLVTANGRLGWSAINYRKTSAAAFKNHVFRMFAREHIEHPCHRAANCEMHRKRFVNALLSDQQS